MFDGLILHPSTENLAQMIADHLPHGLIIDGPSGSGVVTLAKAFASANGSPAFVILPKKKVKNEFVADPKEGSVIIDDIRQLYGQTRTRQPGQQVFIIDTGEKSMTIGAQNAFLKLLEEPRDGVHFIIATHQFDQLLPTIVSRSQRLTLRAVTDEQTNEMITSLGISDATKKTRLAFVGRGRPALIKRMMVDEKAYDARVAIMSDAKTMLGADIYDKFAVIQKYKDSRGDSLTLLDDMNLQLQIVLRSQSDQRLVHDIDRHLRTQSKISAGGNIRLQLAACVL